MWPLQAPHEANIERNNNKEFKKGKKNKGFVIQVELNLSALLVFTN